MAAIRLPNQYQASKVLLADDEPEHSDWLIDYLEAKGFQTVIATNVRDTIEAIEREAFRIYLIDLNIPLGGWAPTVSQVGSTYGEYHGLYILKLVRSQGSPGSHVIAYSAHENEPIRAEIRRLYCRYVVKGRPREFKREIDDLLNRPPPKQLPIVKPRPVKKRAKAVRSQRPRALRKKKH